MNSKEKNASLDKKKETDEKVVIMSGYSFS